VIRDVLLQRKNEEETLISTRLSPGDAFISFGGASGYVSLKAIKDLIERDFELEINTKVAARETETARGARLGQVGEDRLQRVPLAADALTKLGVYFFCFLRMPSICDRWISLLYSIITLRKRFSIEATDS